MQQKCNFMNYLTIIYTSSNSSGRQIYKFSQYTRTHAIQVYNYIFKNMNICTFCKCFHCNHFIIFWCVSLQLNPQCLCCPKGHNMLKPSKLDKLLKITIVV